MNSGKGCEVKIFSREAAFNFPGSWGDDEEHLNDSLQDSQGSEYPDDDDGATMVMKSYRG